MPTPSHRLPPNGLRYWQGGGREYCLGADKTRSHAARNAQKWRRLGEGEVRCDHRSSSLTGSPIPAHERWGSHLPKRSEGVHYPGDRPGRFVGHRFLVNRSHTDNSHKRRFLSHHLYHIQNGFDNYIRLVEFDSVSTTLYNDMRAICGERGKFALQFEPGLLNLSRVEIVRQPHGS